MSAKAPINVVVCWHMHQPEYRDLISGEYQLPWTYLHAVKDYADMAAYLEQTPEARVVVNFAPILLEQIDDCARQTYGYLNDTVAIRDPLLAALDQPALPVNVQQRLALIRACLRVSKARLIDRFPAYQRLAEIAAWIDDKPESLAYLSEQYLADIIVWYHLAWLGESIKLKDERVKRLIAKGSNFTLHERRELLAVISETLITIIPRYRALAERGQVELSFTPYAHPIVPLLLDITSAREAMPDAPMPLIEAYPGGVERARWHMREGLAVFERYFGLKPAGCWPSEGGVSEAALKLLEEYGIRWAATGEGVLRNSLNKSGVDINGNRAAWMFRGYQMASAKDEKAVTCFFRDDGLSDLIGFTYSNWHADDAVSNLVSHLENIADACAATPGGVVPIILDGENAWEYYPNNGYYFLTALYKRLSAHPRIRMTTFSEYLKQGMKPLPLKKLVAGSWVYGTFSTWVGSRDKNRAWDILAEVKRVFDAAVRSGLLMGDQLAAAERQLAICEGSDWFWWFGDYNPANTVSDFERLFRLHVANLYQMLEEEPPEYLSRPISHGGGNPMMGGTMRPGREE